MRTRARVVATIGEYATVLCDRKSACDGCHKLAEGGDCSVCSLMGSGKSVQARAYNAVGAQVGDTVEIETASTRVIGYAALVFLLPIAMVILGYLAAGIWTQNGGLRFAASVLLAAASFVGICLYSERVRKGKTDITIVAVVDPTEPHGDDWE